MLFGIIYLMDFVNNIMLQIAAENKKGFKDQSFSENVLYYHYF